MKQRPLAALWIVLTAALALAAGALAQGEVVPYRGSGLQPFSRSGVVQARSGAIDQACRDAVRQAAEAIMAEGAYEGLEETVGQVIVEQWESYVQGFTIVSERTTSSSYQVTLRVGVFYDRLREDLRNLAVNVTEGDAVMVVAVDPGEEGIETWTPFQDGLEARLVEGGAHVLSAGERARVLGSLDLSRAVTGDFRDLSLLARTGGARFVVFGRRMETDPDGCARRFSVVLLNTDGAEAVFSNTYRIESGGRECGYLEEQAGRNVADVVLDSVPRRQAAVEAGPVYTIFLDARGFSSFADIQRVQGAVLAQPGVEGCRLVQVQPGTRAMFAVSYRGSAEQLGLLLQGVGFEGVGLRVEATEAGRVYILVERPGVAPVLPSP